MLKIINFSKSYGNNGKKAVDNLNLEIKKGEIFGFIGHNGAGKTTTIKAIVGITEFNEGEILIDGLSIKENDIECKNKIAYIPDDPDIYSSLTGIQYLNFIADIYQVEAEEKERLIKKYATMFEILPNLGDIISTYSHGMKQKLVIISALVHSPKLLVLDEPFVGLDPKSAFALKKVMRELCNDGASIFFSSHVLEVVEKLCDKVAIIKNGKLIKCGNVSDIIGDENLESIFLELNEQ
ncbi:MAG: ABC transporter ATP-binding protein [Bacilli bacterium]|nr:ABC transporter ATP-binding protein [Bacilli bacterium]MDD3304553.1 ABC transporter ATP-binding protein [Bacilli bacterium]MDD4053831.1 ABC transporter ATP-binding protein [Bacilli bacterium]MDD4411302.1 ABC transporter ATP-binding protein [Bacilli bacterium]